MQVFHPTTDAATSLGGFGRSVLCGIDEVDESYGLASGLVIVFLLVMVGLPALIVMLRRRGTRIGREEAECNRWQ